MQFRMWNLFRFGNPQFGSLRQYALRYAPFSKLYQQFSIRNQKSDIT